MPNTESEDNIGTENKGVIPKLLGVVSIILGFLDSMLSWRGGFELDPLFIALIFGGVLLYITGSLASKR